MVTNSGVIPQRFTRRVIVPAVTTARFSPTGAMSLIRALPSNQRWSSVRRPRERYCLARWMRSVGWRFCIISTPSRQRSLTPWFTASSTPLSTERTTTSATVPRITPTSVKSERSGCAFTSSRLVRTDSPMYMAIPSSTLRSGSGATRGKPGTCRRRAPCRRRRSAP